MREPKYKYWDGELKQMCDVRAIVWHNNMIANIEVFDSKTMFRNPNMFYGHALLEYTGLKDKNGKEIWEGDIVLDHYGADPQRKWQIVYENAQFQIQTKYLMCYLHTADCLEVIGNIYENPELLEVKCKE